MRLHVRAAMLVAAAFLLAPPVHAAPIDDAKQAGHIGEQMDGFLGAAPGAPASASALVDSINAKRRAKYAEIATKNGTSPEAVAVLAGKKLTGRAPAGQWVRDASGNWTRK